jgi:RimJ/RimL family protein N-acetyltransferase
MTVEELAGRYPKNVSLKNGGKVEIRLMSSSDRDAVLAFARGLPQEDLLFLRVDLTEDTVVDDWISNLGAGFSTSLVAYDGDDLVGYATVHRNPAPWTRRVGEIRVNVGPAFRGGGLGRNLTAQIVDVAHALGVKKLMANMISDQHGAQTAFRHLGFVPEALLADYAEDRNGMARDLVIMSYDVEGLTDRMDEPVRM